MTKDSEKNIAKRNNISTNSVNRILDDISKDKYVKNNGKLPTSFGIDEFSATKDTISKMTFIIVNQDTHNIFDINNSRLSNDIYNYFSRYQRFERNKVKFITMDLYKPYYSLMHKLFPKAILIPDRFHIIPQTRNALDKRKKKYSRNFNKEMSQYDIVQYLINTDETLKYTYNLYQGIIKSITKRDKNKFLNIIHNVDNKKLDKYSKKAIKTFLNFENYIINSFDYELSNGIVEGTNNLIKQVKHNACGYRKFTHLKARIMLIKGIYNPLNA